MSTNSEVIPKITALPYRRGVGIMLLKENNQVFVGRRIDTRYATWQMPQGGIDGDETVIEAGLRELREETGIKNVEILYESATWYYYDLPAFLVGKLWEGQYRGQKQKWLLLRFTGTEDEINITSTSPEFESWKWVDMLELPKTAVSFKRNLYQWVVDEFTKILESTKTNV